MGKVLPLAPTHIAISRQVWICDACGCQDNKSCGCNSTAHMEALAAKRERDRQYQKKSREKAQQNQRSCQSDIGVENTEEFPTVVGIVHGKKKTAPLIMPTEEEAEEEYQQTLFDQACLLLDRMASETRQRFFAHIQEFKS